MSSVNLSGVSLVLRQCFCVSLLCIANAANALGAFAPLPDAELAQVSGQGLVVLENAVNYVGNDFSTVALNADVELNANFGAVQLGTYSAGSDLNISKLQFGRGPGGAVQASTVVISNPYLQFVFDHITNQVIGLRLGFGGISGDVGMTASAISGTMAIDGGAAGILNATGTRWSTFTTGSCPTPGSCTLGNIGDLTAGNGGGASRDFWISMLSKSVQFPATGGVTSTPAQAGVWMNWTDRLAAVNTTGVLSPNRPLGH